MRIIYDNRVDLHFYDKYIRVTTVRRGKRQFRREAVMGTLKWYEFVGVRIGLLTDRSSKQLEAEFQEIDS